MKRILSVILACCLVSACGGGGEPFLAVSATYDEADTEAHVMELTNLYPPPCISLTKILLAAGAVLLIGFLFIKLRAEKKENALLFERITDADVNYDLRYGREVSQLNQNHRMEKALLQVKLDQMVLEVERLQGQVQDRISRDTLMQIQYYNLTGWVHTFQKWIRKILNETQINNEGLLQNIINEEIENLKMTHPYTLYIFEGDDVDEPPPEAYRDPPHTTFFESDVPDSDAPLFVKGWNDE